MKVLLHICCGPCAIYPARLLKEEGHEASGFFYNPNIHPFSEYKRRYAAVVDAADRLGLSVIHHRYDFEEFLRRIAALASGNERHELCWRLRLEETAKVAKAQGMEAFTTTLLSSPYQDVGEIARLGEEIAKPQGLAFLARDFRKGFADSHRQSKEWNLYHQNYCGCLYSEKESVEQREAKAASGRSPGRIFIGAAAALVLAGSLSVAPPWARSQSFDNELPDQKDEPEARTWLEEKTGAKFEVITYHGKDASRRFVELLYREGAITVGVVVLLDEAAALRVYLPGDIRKRGRIFEIVNKELDLNGFPPEKDTGQGRLTLWFNNG